MKKVKFKNAGRAMYVVLCVGLVVVAVVSVVGYRAAVKSVTDGLVTPKDETEEPDLDYSAVDAVLQDIEKSNQEDPTQPTDVPEGNPFAADEGSVDTQSGQPYDDVMGTGDPNAVNRADAAPGDNSADTQINSPGTQTNSTDAQTSDDAFVDVTDELEALYYEQAIIMPVNGEIINAYSEGELVKVSGSVWRTHDGVDIGAAEGTPVKSMTSGTVTEVYNDPLWGCCVVIDHGNTLSGCYYGLAPDLEVAVGDKLNSGDVIGAVGNTADIEADTGPHLHFALKYENRWIDPVSYIEPMK